MNQRLPSLRTATLKRHPAPVRGETDRMKQQNEVKQYTQTDNEENETAEKETATVKEETPLLGSMVFADFCCGHRHWHTVDGKVYLCGIDNRQGCHHGHLANV